MPASLGETLRRALQLLSMTQEELARKAELSNKHVSALVNGRSRLGIGAARKLETATGIPATDLLQVDIVYRDALERRNGRRKGTDDGDTTS